MLRFDENPRRQQPPHPPQEARIAGPGEALPRSLCLTTKALRSRIPQTSCLTGKRRGGDSVLPLCQGQRQRVRQRPLPLGSAEPDAPRLLIATAGGKGSRREMLGKGC